MTDADARLERLVAAEEGECCPGDAAARVDELRGVAGRLPDAAADRAALQTLGDATRHRLARVLAAAGDERCVCELAPLVDVSESAVSHALADLADAGLVDRRKDGQWRYYRATERTRRVLDALDATREVPVR